MITKKKLATDLVRKQLWGGASVAVVSIPFLWWFQLIALEFDPWPNPIRHIRLFMGPCWKPEALERMVKHGRRSK